MSSGCRNADGSTDRINWLCTRKCHEKHKGKRCMARVTTKRGTGWWQGVSFMPNIYTKESAPVPTFSECHTEIMGTYKREQEIHRMLTVLKLVLHFGSTVCSTLWRPRRHWIREILEVSGKEVGTALDNLQEFGLDINASETDGYYMYYQI